MSCEVAVLVSRIGTFLCEWSEVNVRRFFSLLNSHGLFTEFTVFRVFLGFVLTEGFFFPLRELSVFAIDLKRSSV